MKAAGAEVIQALVGVVELEWLAGWRGEIDRPSLFSASVITVGFLQIIRPTAHRQTK